MNDSFKSFQIFNSIEQAKEVEVILKESGVESVLKHTSSTLNAALGMNTNEEAEIFVKESEFDVAQKALDLAARSQINEVEENHYLFEFTDEELYEISLNKEEWSTFDVQLAAKILKDRGNEDTAQLHESLVEKKKEEYSTPESSKTSWLIAGYFFSFFGGIIGLVIGTYLSTAHNTLPDGEKIYKFSESDQRHGKRILIIGGIVSGVWAIAKWKLR